MIRNARTVALLGWVVAGLTGLVVAASGCRRAAAVAELVDSAGQVEREHVDAWGGAAAGARFEIGDAVRTGGGSWARLRVLPASGLRLGERALLRFRVGRTAGEAAVRFETGVAEVEGSTPVLLDTNAGLARAEPGTRLRIRSSSDSTWLEVVVGRAALVTSSGQMDLSEGDGVRVVVGRAEVERYQMDVGAASLEPDVAPPDDPAGKAAPSAPVAAAGPPVGTAPAAAAPAASDAPAPRAARAGSMPRGSPEPEQEGDLDVPAGESATVHVPRLPVTVRIDASRLRCAAGTLVELSGPDGKFDRRGRRARGEAGAALAMGPGAYRYRVNCEGDPAAAPPSARLVITRDVGTAPVARLPPLNDVEADGRKYTIIYQARAPSLRVSWPGASPRGTAQLHVTTGSRTRTRAAVGGQATIPSGALADGPHQLWFSAGSSQSPRTQVTIQFQNAAVTAQIQSPAPGVRWGEGALPVAGVAVEGSHVSAEGQTIALDSAGRFAAQVRPRSGRPLVVRIQHPRGGVHYYLRHSAR